MKKIAAFFIGSIFLFVIACNNKPAKTVNTTTTFKSKNTDSFNLAFDSILVEYNNLKTAFINWDTVQADKSASSLQHLLIYVPYEQLKDDEVATKATSIAQNAADAMQILLSQDSIADKRRIFYTVSESIYNLVKTVGYDKAVIYHKKCPMAFKGDQEGWWFSETKKIDNPYFGNKHPKYKNAMLTCGTVEDSIDNMH
jgi:uncharacterized protein DUF3347